VTLQLTLRSSQGGQHPITLPEGAELERVTINNTPLPIRLEGGKVVLPLRPGTHTIQIAFRDPRGIAFRFVGPAIDLGVASVNAAVRFDMPVKRWVLFAGGVPVGPAVLFWSLLVAFFLVAFGLSRL